MLCRHSMRSEILPPGCVGSVEGGMSASGSSSGRDDLSDAMSFASAFASFDVPLVVGLSGGADSAVAAWAAQQAEVPIRCVHVDHGLDASPILRRAASDIAQHLGVDLEIVSVDAKSSSEADLRDARYAAMLSALNERELLVTAHTADDAVETVLINLMRGTGISGLAGIPPNRDRVARPLLGFARRDIREAALGAELPFVDDPENETSEHLRNRVRHELLPHLESEFQPGIRAALGRLMGAATDAATLIEPQVMTVPLERSACGVRAPFGRLAAQPPAVRRHVYRRMLTAVRGPTAPSAAEVDRMEAVFLHADRGEFDETKAVAFRNGPWLTLAVDVTVEPAPATELKDGLTWGAFHFRFAEDRRLAMLSRWQIVTGDRSLVVRAPHPSDKIKMRSGSKAVDAAIRERGHDPRSHAVVVNGNDEVVWIPGVRHRWVGASFSLADAEGYLVVIANRETSWAPFAR